MQSLPDSSWLEATGLDSSARPGRKGLLRWGLFGHDITHWNCHSPQGICGSAMAPVSPAGDDRETGKPAPRGQTACSLLPLFRYTHDRDSGLGKETPHHFEIPKLAPLVHLTE